MLPQEKELNHKIDQNIYHYGIMRGLRNKTLLILCKLFDFD